MPKKHYGKLKPAEKKGDLVCIGETWLLDILANRYPLTLPEMEQNLDLGIKEYNLLIQRCYQTKNKLSNMEQQCVYLYFWKQMKYREINQMLKTSATGCYIKRARRKIKKAFGINTIT
jgi:DNA-directed RNA polymerase specialized sigma subunit